MNYNYNEEYINDEYYSDTDNSNLFDNSYIWIIIVVLIVIIMTIIGYFADKYNLIKKKKKTNNKELQEKIQNVDNVLNSVKNDKKVKVEEDNQLFTNMNKEDISFSSDISPVRDETNEVPQVVSNQEEDELEKENDISINEPINNQNEIKPDIDDTLSTFTEDIPNKVDNNITEMYELTDDEDFDNNEQSNINLLASNDDEENIVDMELPDIDSIQTDNTPDDFWKF